MKELRYRISFNKITWRLFNNEVEAALIGGSCLKEGWVYFKVREIIHTKFQNFSIFHFQITITVTMI